jgi:hypothetical protein
MRKTTNNHKNTIFLYTVQHYLQESQKTEQLQNSKNSLYYEPDSAENC